VTTANDTRRRKGDLGVREERGARGLLLWNSASLCPALLQLLAQAVGVDQHILRISKLLLPLVAQPAKVRPIPLFAFGEPLDQFEVDLGAVLLNDHAEGFPPLVPKVEFGQLLQLAECSNPWLRL
jgi:hypothetical protein